MRYPALFFALGILIFPALCSGYSFGDPVFGTAIGEEKDFSEPPRVETFIGLNLSRPTFGSQFDGVSDYGGILPVPALDPGIGIGASVGAKRRLGAEGRTAIGFDIYYIRSSHKGPWQGEPGEAVLTDVGLGLSFHLWADKTFQPYVRGAFGFPKMSYTPGPATGLDTLPLKGKKIALGVGVSVYVAPRVVLDVGGSQNTLSFEKVEYFGDEYLLDPKLTSTTFDWETRLSYRF